MRRLLFALLLALPAADAIAYRAGQQGKKVLPHEMGARLPVDDALVLRSSLDADAGYVVREILAAKDRQNTIRSTAEGVVLRVESLELGLAANFRGGRLIGSRPTLWQRMTEAVGNEHGRIKLGFDDVPRGPRYLAAESRLDRVRYWVSERARGYRMVRVDKLYPHPEDTWWTSPSTEALRKHRAYIRANGMIDMSEQGPIRAVVTQDGYAIRNGRHRWEEARKSGLRYVPVVVE